MGQQSFSRATCVVVNNDRFKAPNYYLCLLAYCLYVILTCWPVFVLLGLNRICNGICILVSFGILCDWLFILNWKV